MRQDFTTTEENFNWHSMKLLKNLQIPMDTNTQLYFPRPDPEDCECNVHGLESKKTRYKQLADKERGLQNELIKIQREITNLTSCMLDTRNMEETMKSIYKTDYEKKGLPVAQYRPLMTAVKSPIESLVTPVIDLKPYKDPIRFRYTAMEDSTIKPAKKTDLLKAPEYCSFWGEPFTGCSEYTDTISKIGLSNMKNQQCYLNPLLPSRKRESDCNLPKSQRNAQINKQKWI